MTAQIEYQCKQNGERVTFTFKDTAEKTIEQQANEWTKGTTFGIINQKYFD